MPQNLGIFLILLPIMPLLAAPPLASAATQKVELGGSFVAMATVAGAAKTELLVVTSRAAKPRNDRFAELYQAAGKVLQRQSQTPLWADAAAFDVCRLDPTSPVETVLVVRPEGIYRLGESEPLVAVPTLLAFTRDDSLPKLKVCFDLAPQSPPALVVPTLGATVVFRAPAGQGQRPAYHRDARLVVEADAHYQASFARADSHTPTQRLSVRLDFPEISAADWRHDGRPDLCFSLAETLTCHSQDPSGSYAKGKGRRYVFDVLTDAERVDTTVRVESRLAPLKNGGPLVLMLKKTTWSLTDMGTSLSVFLTDASGGFHGRPAQTLTRKGYFAYHELIDLDGDGEADLVAPVTITGWTDLVRAFVSKSLSIDFVWYKNLGNHFATSPQTLHSLDYPVEPRNLAGVLGALPLWDVHLVANRASKPGEHQVVFFPKREAVEVYALRANGEELLWHTDVKVGSEVLAVDFDRNGVDHLVFASPHEIGQDHQLVAVDTE